MVSKNKKMHILLEKQALMEAKPPVIWIGLSGKDLIFVYLSATLFLTNNQISNQINIYYMKLNVKLNVINSIKSNHNPNPINSLNYQ